MCVFQTAQAQGVGSRCVRLTTPIRVPSHKPWKRPAVIVISEILPATEVLKPAVNARPFNLPPLPSPPP